MRFHIREVPAPPLRESQFDLQDLLRCEAKASRRVLGGRGEDDLIGLEARDRRSYLVCMVKHEEVGRTGFAPRVCCFEVGGEIIWIGIFIQ